jgi:tetratricopeptide (TPR) repeat protein
LKKLRTGYGYSLRRVEERARAEGGEIDNSQLSRYEKGVCYPSFDKLRILANVFNVSIQAFSDVVDLESLDELKPTSGEPSDVVRDGIAALHAGDTSRAFAYFEYATEILQQRATTDETSREELARARINRAAALTRLGKLALAEQELRATLRESSSLASSVEARALLALAVVHTEQGDLHLAELEAERALGFARDEGDDRLAAKALHSLGFAYASRDDHAGAIDRYRQAAACYERLEETVEAARIRVNIGQSYVSLGKHREGIRLLRSALDECRALGSRRLQARCWTGLGEAYFRADDHASARKCVRASNTVIGSGSTDHADLLFVNAWYDWQIGRLSDNPTREKIAFGRLKMLRSHVEKRFPEVDAFDEFVSGGRDHA